MRILTLSLAFCFGLVPSFVLQAEEAPATNPADKKSEMTLEEEGSYLIGVQLGMQAGQAKDQLGLNPELILAGMRDALAGEKLKVDAQSRWEVVIPALQEKSKQRSAGAGAENLAKGKAYLESLRGKDGFTFTDSGIGYEILTAGEGSRPTADSSVKVHYRGTTIDGKEFDSSYKRGKPTEFPLKGVIAGWTEGLQLMPTGSKYRFHIPAHLAYGERAPASIGPNQVLIFDVELLEITK